MRSGPSSPRLIWWNASCEQALKKPEVRADKHAAIQAFAERIQHEHHAGKTQGKTHHCASPEGYPKQRSGQDRTEQRSGVVEQNSDQERPAFEIEEEAELRDKHRANAQPFRTAYSRQCLPCLAAQHRKDDQTGCEEPKE